MSKRVFIIIAAILLVSCVIAYLLLSPGTGTDIFHPGSNDPETTELELPDLGYPDAPIPTDPTKPAVFIANNVTIHQVERDPNEVIDRTTNFTPDHPEYVNFNHSNPICCAAGCVFRNDKTITIDIPDTYHNSSLKISFGMITRICNRFLYLNPMVESSMSGPWLFHFETVNGGNVMTVNESSTDPLDNAFLTMHRTLDNTTNARYRSPQNPGAIWYTQAPKDGPFYVNCIVMNSFGDFCASLQITIDRAEDGTYSIVDLDNRDLRYAEHGEYNAAELEYLLGQTNQVINDKDQVHFSLTGADPDKPLEISMDHVIFDLRDQDTKLYFSHFVPVDPDWKTRCDHYTNQLMPIIAVNARGIIGERTCTMYFQVLRPPYDGNHGEYLYIGRDYTQYNTVDNLKGASYPGEDLYGD